ncbi:MAG: potassium channel protein [Desulfobacteraceae bacterium]|nr:MAG: potassium channel protein [Desulfobacteraceae bacterium]
METTKYFISSIILSLLILAFGTAGYMYIENWDFLDALYMTVITVTTVGFGEINQIGKYGRIFTMLLIFSGAGFFLYVGGLFMQFIVEGRVRAILGRRRLDKKIHRLKNHYIVCGYGRIGRVLCENLKTKPVDLVVIEKDEAHIPAMERDDVLYICGDASEEVYLQQAGIERAKMLVAALATDTDNVFLVLTARQMNPNIFIMARASSNKTKSKLLAAGANKVESPYDIGAVSMAQRIIRPTVTNFLDLAFEHQRKDIKMEEIPVSDSSKLANVLLKDSGIRQQLNLILIAIKKQNGDMMFNPSFETVIRAGDTVIAVGEGHNLLQLEKILNPQ